MKNVENVYKKLEGGVFDPSELHISINTSVSLDESYVHLHIVDLIYGAEDAEPISIGEARCMTLDSFNCFTNKSLNLLRYADEYDGDLAAAVYPVVDDNGFLKVEYTQLNMLYIDRFYIKPEFRGNGISQLMFVLLIDVLAKGVGVVTIIPAPFEDNGHDEIDKKDERYKPVLKQMTSFIKQFNFKRVSKDKSGEVWAKDTSLA